MKAAGLPPMTLSALRHAFVSKLFERGVPIEVISRLVRHSNVATTQAVYLHRTTAAIEGAAARLDDLFADTGS